MKKLMFFFIFSSVAFLVSCSSNKGKDEGVCVIGECIGTKCFESTGNTCSTISECKAVTGGCGNQQLTVAAIDEIASKHAQELLKDHTISEEHVEDVTNLVKNILKKQEAYSTPTK